MPQIEPKSRRDISEFGLIDRIRHRLQRSRRDVALGIGDDAALLRIPLRRELVATTDTLVAGVHFPRGTEAEALGWKALAVNLSDLAAMGAEPRWVLLALTLPKVDMRFVRAFMRGFGALAARHGVALVGGDTTRGPLAVGVTALGVVPAGSALRRTGARVGDDLYVSGTPGDAAAGLALIEGRLRAPARARRILVARLERPQPRIALGLALRGAATSCIDVSDGLAADLGHVLRAGGVGATLDLAALPRSEALALAQPDEAQRTKLQLAGGDDYELCFTAPASSAAPIARVAKRLKLRLTRIGTIERRRGLRLVGADGASVRLARTGYEHFAR
jgi:thiamine-monophosphate kinase